MILDHSDLKLVTSIHELLTQIRTHGLSAPHEARVSWRQQLDPLVNELCERALANATTFDGVIDDGMEGYLLCFTDYAPKSPAYGASFVVGLQEDTTMHSISERRELKRREFTEAAARRPSTSQPQPVTVE